MKKFSFTKMHGTGNDFVVINALRSSPRVTPALARRLADRHFGVGADQILTIGRSSRADFSMRIHNNDGSEVEMCGNGIRCAARYVWERGWTRKKSMVFETPAGLIRPEIQGDNVVVDMGEPILDAARIPTRAHGRVIDVPLLKVVKALKTSFLRGTTETRDTLKVTCVSMGNPHAVIFIRDVERLPLEVWGPLIENDHFFPRRVNVEFVEITGVRTARVRVWERGAGITMACGTGACAVAVAGVLTGRLQRRVRLSLPGGDLDLEWKANNRVSLAGPAEFVYEGEFYV